MRVLVCRPSEEADATARKLRAMDHEAVLAPVLAIVPLPAVLPDGRYDGVVATSRHAAESLAAADVERLRGLPAFAVGATTAAALRTRGFVDVRVGAGDASGLPALRRLTLPPRARLLYLAGVVHKPTLPESLRALGDVVDVVEVYDALPAGSWPEAIVADLAGGRIRACLHFSRRSAALALAEADRAGVSAAFLALRHLCLSPDVAVPLTAAGASEVVVAPNSQEASLLQAL